MLAKITSKNQPTLPKAITQAVGASDYFDVEVRAGQIVLTPVRIHRGDGVRAKLEELGLTDGDAVNAVAWARSAPTVTAYVSEPVPVYSPAKKVAAKKSARKK